MTEVPAALRDLEKRLSQDPDNLRLRLRVALLLRQVGRSAEAAKLLRSVAFAYRDSDQHDEALAIGRSVLEISPSDSAVQALVAELEHRDDDITSTRGEVAVSEPTLVEPSTPVVQTSERTRSASLAALISRPRIASRPPPLRAQGASPLAHGIANEETPLPGALPYHIAEPTTPASKLPFGVVGVRSEPTDPSETSNMTGLAEAARRISGLIADDGATNELAVDSLRSSPRGRTSPPVPVDDIAPHSARRGDGRDAEEELTSPRDVPENFSDPDVHRLERSAPIRGRGATDPLSNLFFSSLSESARNAARQKFESKRVTAGTIVIRQGALAPPLIVVVAGKLELRFERANTPDTILDTIEAGFYVGEAALLGRASAPANVVAVVDSDLLTLSPQALFELASAHPALWAALKDTAERRTRRYDSVMRVLP